MELTTIEMPADEAREHARSYLSLPEGSLTDEDKAVLAGYLALAEGKPVIEVNKVLTSAGLDTNGCPMLGLARADWAWCHLSTTGSWRWDHTVHAYVPRTSGTAWVEFTPAHRPHHSSWTYSMRWPLGVPEQPLLIDTHGVLASQVPSIPPQHRPKRWQLHRYWILWEVPEWAEHPAAAADPALLRDLGHGLATVEATWDLTPLEQAVLGMRS